MENTEVTKVPFETVRIPDNTKFIGEEVLVSDGVDGTRIVVSIDGHVTSDRTVAPKNAVIYYGTKEVEDDFTSEPPQEEPEKQPPVNTETVTNPSQPITTPDFNQPQGRLEQSSVNLMETSSMNSPVLKKAALEFARLLVFALPGFLITVLTNNPELGGSLGATILLVLKSVDRAIHEDKTNDIKGLLPF